MPKDGYGDTALLLALKKRDLHIAELLLQREEIDVNARDGHGDTALLLALKDGDPRIVELLKRLISQ